MTFLSAWTPLLPFEVGGGGPGFSFRGKHPQRHKRRWLQRAAQQTVTNTVKRARVFTSPASEDQCVESGVCICLCVSGGCLWSLTLLGTFCSFWQVRSVCVCVCVFVCVHGSDPSHLICPWNEMNNQPPPPPAPALLSLVWIARLISHSLEGLEANESWQHNGIVSADGEPKS